jgi:hypothetical protein
VASRERPYTSENVSDHPIRILEVDLKGPPKKAVATTNLDAVAVDSAHFKVMLEKNSSGCCAFTTVPTSRVRTTSISSTA